jgi:hypothetical protein
MGLTYWICDIMVTFSLPLLMRSIGLVGVFNYRGEASSAARGVVVLGGDGSINVLQQGKCLYVVAKKLYSASTKLSLI